MSIETLNLILGIGASILTIISLLWNHSNSNKIKRFNNTINGGSNSVNNIGSKNKTKYVK